MFHLSPQAAVREFHKRYGYAVATRPQLGGYLGQAKLQHLEEELGELRSAVESGDLVEVADALGDLLYVVYGYGVACGMDLDAVFWEIHRSNMTKTPVPGAPKPAKGAGYSAPRIAEVIGLLASRSSEAANG